MRTKLTSRLDQNWPGLTAICRIERIRETMNRCSREVIYAITSLPQDKLVPDALLKPDEGAAPAAMLFPRAA